LKKHIEEEKQDGKEVEGLGKGADFLKKMEGLSMSCKSPIHCCLVLLLAAVANTCLIAAFPKEASITSSSDKSVHMSDNFH
jgi:hypothetical protein